MDLVELETLRGVDAHAAHLVAVESRLREIDQEANGRPLDTERQAEWEDLDTRRQQVDAALVQLRQREDYIRSMAEREGNTEPPREWTPPAAQVVRNRVPDNLHDLAAYRTMGFQSQERYVGLLRDGAKRIAEQADYPHPSATEERTAGRVHRLLDTIDVDGRLSRHIIATSDPAYLRAFGKVSGGQNVIQLSADEQRAIATVGASQLGDGGYAVPFTLDPTVILTNDGAISPLRQIARVEPIIGNTWKGVTSAGITVTRGPAEETAITDDSSPTFTQPTVTVGPVKALAKVSIEATEDWPRVFTELAIEFQDAKDREEAISFITGTGAGEGVTQPGGIVGSLAPTSYVATADTSPPLVLALGDIFKLKSSLGVRFRDGASWLANESIYDLVRQFGAGTVGDSAVWTYGIADGRPDRLLGKPAYEASAMADDMTATNIVAIYGNFRYFLIAEKVGMTVEVIPHLFNGEGQVLAQRGVFMHYRNSSVILADDAFRALHAGTIAS